MNKLDHSNVNSSILCYYLERIHGFLLSDKKSQIFKDLSKNIEDVLVKITTDHEFLLCDSFDDDCKSVSAKILNVLENNKHSFQLEYSFEDGGGDKKVLVYKKTDMDIFKQPKPLRPPNTMKLKPVSTNYSEQDAITTSFKLRCLNATLKFIKDDTQLIMQFPDMATTQAEFVYSMLTQNNDSELGFGYKSLYAPISEAMRIFSLKYKFDVSYVPPRLGDMKRIKFEKIPLNAPENVQKNPVVEKCKIFPSLPERTVTLTKPPPPQTKLKDSIKELNPILMTDALRKIANFLSDESQGKLTFCDVKINMSQFIQNFENVIKKNCYKIYLPTDCSGYVNIINEWMEKKLYSVTKKENKTTVDTRSVTLQKIENKKVEEVNNNNTEDSPSASDDSGSATSLISQMSNVQKIYRAKDDTEKPNLKISVDNKHRERSLSPGRRVIKQTLTKSSSYTKLNTAGKQEKSRANITKAKLMEGLSQPIKSDIAMKMMLNMGWQGGALGLRGEGITEPIMLSLDKANRAGLGHVKPVKPAQAKPRPAQAKPIPAQAELSRESQKEYVAIQNDYHKASIENILGVLTSGLESKIFIYPPDVLSKEWNFIQHIIINTNIRSKIGLTPELLKISNKILDIMKVHPEYVLTACYGADDRALLITRLTAIYQPNHKFWTKIASQPKNVEQNIKKLTKTICNESYAYFILSQILNFCNIDLKEKEIKTNGVLSKKQKSYLKNITQALNKNKPLFSMSNNELDLFEEICLVKQGFELESAVDKYNTSFTLTKIYIKQKENIDNTNKNINANERIVTVPSAIERTVKVPSYTKHFKNSNQETDSAGKVTDNAGKVSDNAGKLIGTAGKLIDAAGKVNDNIGKVTDNVGKVTDNDGKVSDNAGKVNDTRGKISDNNNNSSKRFNVNNDETINKTAIENKLNNIMTKNVAKLKALLDDKSKIDSQKEETVDYITIVESSETAIGKITENHDTKANDSGKIKDESGKTEFYFDKIKNESGKTEFDVGKITDDSGKITDDSGKVKEHDKIDDNKIINDDCKKDLLDLFYDVKNPENCDISVVTDSDLENELLNSDNDDNSNDSLNDVYKKFIKNEPAIALKIENVIFKETSPGKRLRSTSASTEDLVQKKCNIYIKNIKIVPKDYPTSIIDKKKASEIQKKIIETIDKTKVYPSIECHGIQDGGLIYSCHNEKSYKYIADLLKCDNIRFNLIENVGILKKTSRKMMFKIHSYVDENSYDILERIGIINKALNIGLWEVTKEIKYSDFIIVYVNIDLESFEYIKERNFALYAGIDQAKFSILWD